MTFQKASQLRERVLTLLLIERDQVQEQLELLGYRQGEPGPIKQYDKLVVRPRFSRLYEANRPKAS